MYSCQVYALLLFVLVVLALCVVNLWKGETPTEESGLPEELLNTELSELDDDKRLAVYDLLFSEEPDKEEKIAALLAGEEATDEESEEEPEEKEDDKEEDAE